jgi:hypothetical protein
MNAVKDELYNIFNKYKTNIFIETGTFKGHSVARALDLGYSSAYSIEINFENWAYCIEQFEYDARAILFYGDSLTHLPLILGNVNQQCTFWLDAHMSGISRNCPTIEELKIIGQHSIKNHIILIDDMMDFGTPAHEGITINDLQNEVLKINPDYKFSFESTSKPNNVMVCKV